MDLLLLALVIVVILIGASNNYQIKIIKRNQSKVIKDFYDYLKTLDEENARLRSGHFQARKR